MSQLEGVKKHNKNQSCSFPQKGKAKTDKVFSLGEQLEVTSNYRYLGTILNEHMNIEKMSEWLMDVGSRALGGILSLTRNNYDLGYSSYMTMFNSCVAPILDYATRAWCCGSALPKVDAVQNHAIRFYCGLPKTAAILGVIGDMGWTPSIVRRDIETLRLFNQIVTMPRDRLTRQILEWDALQGGERTSNVETLLDSIGNEESWVNRTPVNTVIAHKKLYEMFQSTWKLELQNKPKLRTYVKLKEGFGVEPHLVANLKKNRRVLISQLHVGCLPIVLETGQYQGKGIED